MTRERRCCAAQPGEGGRRQDTAREVALSPQLGEEEGEERQRVASSVDLPLGDELVDHRGRLQLEATRARRPDDGQAKRFCAHRGEHEGGPQEASGEGPALDRAEAVEEVAPQREEDAHSGREHAEAREHGVEGVALGGVGEGHRLFELVDDEEQAALALPSPPSQTTGEQRVGAKIGVQGSGRPAEDRRERERERGERLPAWDEGHHVPALALAQGASGDRRDDAGAHERRLARARRRGHEEQWLAAEPREHGGDLFLAAEEEPGVLGLEGTEPAVGVCLRPALARLTADL